jgi:DNA mismatch repair ATPase MutL
LLEAALEDALDAEMEDFDDDFDEENDDFEDDDDEDDDEDGDDSEEYEGNNVDSEGDPSDDESEPEDKVCSKRKAERVADELISQHKNKAAKKDADSAATAVKADPPNFSRIKTTRIPSSKEDKAARQKELKDNFPLFVANAQSHSVEVVVEAGQMLYLPAGWFHEVFSGDSKKGTASDRSHMAFNFWFHPPDGESFEKPYVSSFWADDWSARVAEGSLC